MGLFDINTLLKENTLDELVVKPYSKETFMFRSIEALRKFNESNMGFTKELYKSLNEATSKEEENKVFGDFYNKYNKILDNYINEVRTIIDRFSINLDNLADANIKLANDQEVLSCDKEFAYNIRRYKNLTASKYPRFNALAIYQKEFDYIGQMMEDLGPIATDIAKLEVLATVTNAFCNKMKNKWLEKCIEEITGEDDCEDLTCYAKVLNDIFVDKEEQITVNRGTIYAMREEITGYEKYKDAVLLIGDKLINDFTYMSNNIGSLFYRNKDKVLAIRSDNKDVSNRDYQLNTYGMNQLDIFMKSKANQVAQMCSLYVIALSVMMDNIIAHITQCGDLLDKVKDEIERIDEPAVDNTSASIPSDIPEETPETEEPEMEDDDIEGGEEGIEDPDEEPEEDPADVMYDNDEPEESNFELDDPEEEVQEQVPQEPEEPEVEELPSNESYVDFDREVALFEYAMYAMDTVLEQEAMLHYVHRDILREDAATPNVTGYGTDDATFIEKIVITLQNIWNKFTNLFQTKTTQRAEFIKKSSATIQECNMNIGTGFKCTEYQKINLLGELVAKPLQYESMRDDLANETTFFKEHYKSFTDKLTDGTSIKEAIKLTIIPDKEKMQTITNPNPLIEFCINFGNQFNDIQKSIKDVKNASVMAKSIAKSVKMNTGNNNNDNKQSTGAGDNKPANDNAGGTDNASKQESTLMYNTHEDYLKEAVEVTKPPKGTKQETSSDNPLKQVRNYFRVTTTVVSQRMTLSQTIFNDYFSILNGALKANGKPAYTGKKEPTSTATTNTTDNKTPEKS